MGSNLLLRSNPKIIPSTASCSTEPCFGRRFTLSTRAVASSEPPWHVRVPARGISSHGNIPISLRLLQLQKKRFSRRQQPENPSVICLIEELHKLSMFATDEAKETRVCWDLTEPLISLFLHVLSTSPSLLLEIVGLIVGLFALSVERSSSGFDLEMEPPMSVVSGNSMDSTGSEAVSVAGDSSEIGDRWRTGIVHEFESVGIDYHEKNCVQHRSHYYELMIVREKHQNSLILSNYAQFLYQFEREIDRAQEYFKLALKSEPVDGEVSNKYAKFLWHERGDFAGAEEMFLKAIEADPTSSYHQSSYANFLFLTGGDETCYPLDQYGPASVC